MPDSWPLWLKRILAKWFIRRGKLAHVDYTADEITALIKPHFPAHFNFAVPSGTGQLTLMDCDIAMHTGDQHIDVQMFAAVDIRVMNTDVYRAHIIAHLRAKPHYISDQHSVALHSLDVADIRLVNDSYSLVRDTTDLLSQFVPKPLQNLVGGTVKTALGLLTGGGSDTLLRYLELYLSGSKQRILDYHRPQLERLIDDVMQDNTLSYALDPEDWEERLFIEHGESVVVEDGVLRFRFAPV
ncbi:hypothetical protein LJ739_08210 [Aestuariibacter halophilus]|uniref:DUF1439 domain-containing protein n=1 Tax=Fluctibacter halophilus TaxID=226011 RepID=A0ABS8G6P4_9ALTE|nr:hypothetical protein [Aestuariibacter halophilus]MCC2616220.1 hypothetical protein [Aestuariibacter halophilus]